MIFTTERVGNMEYITYAGKRLLLSVAIMLSIIYIGLEIVPDMVEKMLVYGSFGFLTGYVGRMLADKIITKPEDIDNV